jgi:hypothetical protein
MVYQVKLYTTVYAQNIPLQIKGMFQFHSPLFGIILVFIIDCETIWVSEIRNPIL